MLTSNNIFVHAYIHMYIFMLRDKVIDFHRVFWFLKAIKFVIDKLKWNESPLPSIPFVVSSHIDMDVSMFNNEYKFQIL